MGVEGRGGERRKEGSSLSSTEEKREEKVNCRIQWRGGREGEQKGFVEGGGGRKRALLAWVLS